MLIFRKMEHNDYDDIVEISKNIWGGQDYLPKIFHEWVDADGCFFAAVDSQKNKVIGTAKYSILYDGSGWLEGLRVHIDYRGQKIARKLSEHVLNYAKQELEKGHINKIAFGTHITNIESIALMEKLNFKLKQKYIIISKGFDSKIDTEAVKNYSVEYCCPSYDEFISLKYFKERNNILPLAFVFQEPTRRLYDEFIKHNIFVSINGHKGVFKLKGEPYFEVFDESIEGIDCFMNYYLYTLNGLNVPEPSTSVLPENIELIENLRKNGFYSWSNWIPDYFLYIYEQSKTK